jgi:hypothetical protein
VCKQAPQATTNNDASERTQAAPGSREARECAARPDSSLPRKGTIVKLRPLIAPAFLLLVITRSVFAQGWQIVPSPNHGQEVRGNTLLAVDAISPTDAWAVGFHQYTDFCTACPGPLAIHWDGVAWSLVNTPTVPLARVELRSVAAVHSNNVWAVGYAYPDCGLCSRTMIQHWDGISWSIVPSPNPGVANYLNGVTAVSANDIWAVGYRWNDWSTWEPLILHYNGATWTAFDQPRHAFGQLDSVFALSSNDVWAVGVVGVSSTGIGALALHWDGASWTRVPVPNEDGGYVWMRDISGVAPNDLWAVGVYKYLNGNGHTISSARTWHWDGVSWTRVLYGGIAGQDSRMYGIHAIARDDVWAVGGGDPPFGSGLAFEYRTVHWDGVRWNYVENPRQGVLYAIGASSSSDVWAVGFGMDALAYSTGTHTLRYNAPPLCYANCDRSSTAPVLNVQDFICFLQRFAAGDSYSNCDASTTWPELNVEDFTCFLQRFGSGCP